MDAINRNIRFCFLGDVENGRAGSVELIRFFNSRNTQSSAQYAQGTFFMLLTGTSKEFYKTVIHLRVRTREQVDASHSFLLASLIHLRYNSFCFNYNPHACLPKPA
ncbi:MAG TPA: hypothetical protein VLK33_12865 [Terriglobales bacterium]|nr:hypothetical protein [Terriglobales bacterium]